MLLTHLREASNCEVVPYHSTVPTECLHWWCLGGYLASAVPLFWATELVFDFLEAVACWWPLWPLAPLPWPTTDFALILGEALRWPGCCDVENKDFATLLINVFPYSSPLTSAVGLSLALIIRIELSWLITCNGSELFMVKIRVIHPVEFFSQEIIIFHQHRFITSWSILHISVNWLIFLVVTIFIQGINLESIIRGNESLNGHSSCCLSPL